MTDVLTFVAAYKEKIGFKGQFLIEPKPKEPSKHQYDYGKKFWKLSQFSKFFLFLKSLIILINKLDFLCYDT